MPRNKFKFDEIMDTAKNVSKKIQYPINSFDDVARALGGDNADIPFEGKGHKIGQIRRLIPAEYFPIESEEDLVAKIAQLRGEGGEADTDPVTYANPVAAPEKGKENPPNIPAHEIPKARGVPAVKGWK
jgi:hypothetical protein